MNCDSERFTTTALYVCVFNCGQNKRSPFCVRISEPRDKISGCVIEIRKEINKIIKDNKEGLTNIKLKSGRVLKNMAEKEAYWDFRISLNNRMKVHNFLILFTYILDKCLSHFVIEVVILLIKFVYIIYLLENYVLSSLLHFPLVLLRFLLCSYFSFTHFTFISFIYDFLISTLFILPS